MYCLLSFSSLCGLLLKSNYQMLCELQIIIEHDYAKVGPTMDNLSSDSTGQKWKGDDFRAS